jgi:hypothetical protein
MTGGGGGSVSAAIPVPIETYGWDTVFALRLDLFNRIESMAASGPFRIGFDYNGVGKDDTWVDWSFGPFSLNDVYGAEFDLSAPLLNTKVTPQTAAAFIGTCSVTANMLLLKNSPPGSVQPWASVSVEATSNDAGVQAVVEYGLQTWFATEAARPLFDPLFASMTAKATGIEKDDWYVAKATRLSGAVMAAAPTRKAVSDKAVAVLARTRSDDVTGAQIALSPEILSADVDAAYMISASLFLSALIAPALAAAFGTAADTAQHDFPVSDDVEITNAIALTLSVSRGKDGPVYKGAIEPGALHVRMETETLLLMIDQAAFDISIGPARIETINMQLIERMTVKVVPSPDDPSKMHFMLANKEPPQVITEKDESLWLIGGQALVQIVGTIIAALIGKFVPGAAEESLGISRLAARLLAGLLDIIVQGEIRFITWLPERIADVEADWIRALPPFDAVMGKVLPDYGFVAPLGLRPISARFAGGLLLELAPKP